MLREGENGAERGKEDAFLLLTCRYIGVDRTAAAVFYALSLSCLSRETCLLILCNIIATRWTASLAYQFRQSPSIICAALQHRFLYHWIEDDVDNPYFWEKEREILFAFSTEKQKWINRIMLREICLTTKIYLFYSTSGKFIQNSENRHAISVFLKSLF